MSALTLGQQGVTAADASNWDLALPTLTKALNMSPTKPPLWLLARSKALIAKRDFPAALADAELAYHVASDRNNRALMMEAQYRRAVAFYRLGQYANADCCCVWSMYVAEGKRMSEGEEQARRVDAGGDYDVTPEEVQEMVREKTKRNEGGGASEVLGMVGKGGGESKPWMKAVTFRTQCIFAMQKLEKGAEGRKVTAQKNPPRKELEKVEIEEEKEVKVEKPEKKQQQTQPTVVAPQKPKEVKVDSYQTDQKQTVTIYVKGVDKEKFKLVWNAASEVTMEPVPGTPGEVLSLKFSGDASQEESTVRVTPTKIELILKKGAPGKWAKPDVITSSATPAPEPTKPAAVPSSTPSTSAPVPAPAPAPAPKPKEDHPPAYPTSSKSGPKDWDAIADDKDDGDDAPDADAWFKKLYAGATEEQRRAMMKSFTESNGTALSTDWNDVKGRTVETKPPEGVEARKWD